MHTVVFTHTHTSLHCWACWLPWQRCKRPNLNSLKISTVFTKPLNLYGGGDNDSPKWIGHTHTHSCYISPQWLFWHRCPPPPDPALHLTTALRNLHVSHMFSTLLCSRGNQEERKQRDGESSSGGRGGNSYSVRERRRGGESGPLKGFMFVHN